jgi:hypothetical protein
LTALKKILGENLGEVVARRLAAEHEPRGPTRIRTRSRDPLTDAGGEGLRRHRRLKRRLLALKLGELALELFDAGAHAITSAS